MPRVFKSLLSKFLFCCHKPKVYEEDARTIFTVVGEDDAGVEFFDAQDLEGYEATVVEGEDHVLEEPNANIGAFHGELVHGGDEKLDAQVGGGFTRDDVLELFCGDISEGDVGGLVVDLQRDAGRVAQVLHGGDEDGDAEEEGCIAVDYVHDGVTGEEEDGDVEKEWISIAGDDLWEVVHGGEENGDAEGERICIAAAAVHGGFYGGEEDGDTEEEGICIAAAEVNETVHVEKEDGGVEGEGVAIAASYAHEIVYGRREDEEELTIVGDDIQKVDHGGEEDEHLEGEGIHIHKGVCDGAEVWDAEVGGICNAAATIPEVDHGGEEEEDAAVEGISISAADVHEAVHGGGEDGDAKWNVICIPAAGVHEVAHGGEEDKEAIGIRIGAASVQVVVNGREEEEDAEVKRISIAGDDVREIFHGGEEEEDATVEGISISAADVHEADHAGGEDGDAEWNEICIVAAGVHEVAHGGEEDKEAIGIRIGAASVQVVVNGREEEEDSEVEGINIAGDDDHKGFQVGVDDMDGELTGKGFCMSGNGHEVFKGENEGDVESEGAYKALGGGNQLVDPVDADGVVRVFPKREDFEVFVGGLDKRTTESDLRKVFCTVGQVVQVRLVMNSMTNESKGFAFLQFAAVEQAKRAVLELNNTFVNGRRCGVTANQGRGRFAPTNSRRDRGAFFGGWVPKSLPPHPPSPNPTFAGRGRGGFRGHVAPRNIQGDRQPLRNLYDGARGLPPPESFYDRRPPVPSYPKNAQGSYNIRNGLSYNGSRSGSGGGRCFESFGRGYLSRGSDVDGSSYSLYTGRGYCGKGYCGSSSYY